MRVSPGSAASNYVDYFSTAEQRSFARLTPEALSAIAALGPLVDVGAGNGYWDRVLFDLGVDVVAIEPNTPKHPVYPRIHADHTAIVDYPDRALLMIWPTLGADWPAECVQLYQGDTVAYVGDLIYAETANPRLYRELVDSGFKRIAKIKVESWPGLMFTDYLLIWKRLGDSLHQSE